MMPAHRSPPKTPAASEADLAEARRLATAKYGAKIRISAGDWLAFIEKARASRRRASPTSTGEPGGAAAPTAENAPPAAGNSHPPAASRSPRQAVLEVG